LEDGEEERRMTVIIVLLTIRSMGQVLSLLLVCLSVQLRILGNRATDQRQLLHSRQSASLMCLENLGEIS